MARANDEREQIRVDLSGLNAAIDVHAGDAVEEELADVNVRVKFVRCKDEHVIGWNPLWWWGSRWNGRKGRSRRRVSESVWRGMQSKPEARIARPGEGNVGAVVEPSAEGSQ